MCDMQLAGERAGTFRTWRCRALRPSQNRAILGRMVSVRFACHTAEFPRVIQLELVLKCCVLFDRQAGVPARLALEVPGVKATTR